MKKAWPGLLLLVLSACGSDPQKGVTSSPAVAVQPTAAVDTNTSYAAAEEDTEPLSLPKPIPVKSPSGTYQFLMPDGSTAKVEHTVRFYPNHTFRLQERYTKNKGDSIAVTKGTWTPSGGAIWLYKDQVVRARYKWKGDTLQYLNAGINREYALNKLTDITQSKAWINKKSEGVVLFGVGNEPFWSIEFNNRDTLSFLLSEWSSPLRFKRSQTLTGGDTTTYVAQNDSLQLRVKVLPYFCNDGMSDYIYSSRIQVEYNKQTFNGCGVVFR